MLVSKTHREPTNSELGVRPYPKAITWPCTILAGAALWYLMYLAIV